MKIIVNNSVSRVRTKQPFFFKPFHIIYYGKITGDPRGVQIEEDFCLIKKYLSFIGIFVLEK